MWHPEGRQWWAVWSAAGVVLLVWWLGAADAAYERATNTPDFLWEQAEITREMGGRPLDEQLPLAKNLAESRQSRVERALAIERRTRLIGTVLLAALLTVWRLASQESRQTG